MERRTRHDGRSGTTEYTGRNGKKRKERNETQLSRPQNKKFLLLANSDVRFY
jgi:hypothetical protein